MEIREKLQSSKLNFKKYYHFDDINRYVLPQTKLWILLEWKVGYCLIVDIISDSAMLNTKDVQYMLIYYRFDGVNLTKKYNCI